MKQFRNLTFLFLATLSLCVGFTSCGDDDDDPVTAGAADIIAGAYTDDMTCSVMGQASTYEDVTVNVTKVSDGVVSIALPSFGSGAMTLPVITLRGVKVSGSATTATIAEQEIKGTVVNASGAEKEYTCTIAGTYNAGHLTLNYSLQYGSMPMAMVCSFAADKTK